MAVAAVAPRWCDGSHRYRRPRPLADRGLAHRHRLLSDSPLTPPPPPPTPPPPAVPDPPRGFVVRRREPVEAIPAGKFPTALWGGPGEHDERARRAVNRVHSLLGHGAVLVPVPSGGGSPAAVIERIPRGGQSTG